eukprot:3821401-Pyramimonas_sp.AAC.1
MGDFTTHPPLGGRLGEASGSRLLLPPTMPMGGLGFEISWRQVLLGPSLRRRRKFAFVAISASKRKNGVYATVGRPSSLIVRLAPRGSR